MKTITIMIIGNTALALAFTLTIIYCVWKLKEQQRKLDQSMYGMSTVGHIGELLNKMQGELTRGDFEVLIKRANALPVVKYHGEFSHLPGLERVIFTEYPKGKQL